MDGEEKNKAVRYIGEISENQSHPIITFCFFTFIEAHKEKSLLIRGKSKGWNGSEEVFHFNKGLFNINTSLKI